MQIVTFKWTPLANEEEKIPSQTLFSYDSNAINIFYNMVDRNITIPYEKVCITDNPEGLHKDIRVVPLWDKCRMLGGCYNRLYAFSKDMENVIGKRFIMLDVDCVILNNIDDIVNRKEDFVIGHQKRPDLHYLRYHGGMILMNAGCRDHVWETFNKNYRECIRKAKEIGYIGTDQAIIRLLLKEEAGWDQSHGVLDMRVDVIEKGIIELPKSAKIVQFSGPRDPREAKWQHAYPWVKKNYC